MTEASHKRSHVDTKRKIKRIATEMYNNLNKAGCSVRGCWGHGARWGRASIDGLELKARRLNSFNS